MKYLLTAVLLVSSFSFAQAEEMSELDIQFKEDVQLKGGDKEYQWKQSISCSIKKSGKDPAYPNLSAVSYYECPDKTVSFVQPNSTGLNGWEGYCGQTAMSNAIGMLCNRFMEPKSNDYYGTDLSPGQAPRTLRVAINKAWTEKPSKNTCPTGKWVTRNIWSHKDFLKSVKGDVFGSHKKVRRFRSSTTYVEVTPTLVLLNNGGLGYHWVTVVDFLDNSSDKYGCDVVVNTWGDQRVLTCEKFVYYGDHSGMGHTHIGYDK